MMGSFLAAYTYCDICYTSTHQHANDDILSRLPLPEVTPVAQSPEASIWNIARIERYPVSANEIGHATEKDPQLKDVLPYTKQG